MIQQPAINARKNPLKVDPSRTSRIRAAFASEFKRRLRQLDQDIYNLIVELDVFGLVPPTNPIGNVQRREWAFLTSDEKLRSFKRWLKQQVEARIYSTDQGGKPWTAKYIESAYKKGIVRAYEQSLSKQALREFGASATVGSTTSVPSEAISRQILRSSFARPERLSKARLLATRTYEQLPGITEQMSTKLGRTLADGIIRGDNPKTIARTISREIRGISTKRATTIARTEIIHAHAEGQLDAFEDLAIEEIETDVEWSTAKDEKVCPLCKPLEGVVIPREKARGMLGRHPNCRCAFKPATKEYKRKGQIWTPKKRNARIRRSILAETRKKSVREAKSASVWAGRNLV